MPPTLTEKPSSALPALVLGVIVWIALSAGEQAKSYYVTIAELQQMGNKAYTRHLRVAGNVQPGSITRVGTNATFTLVEEAIRTCVSAGASASEDPHTDTWLLWAALHGVATLEKPARTDYQRLGPLDRPAMLETLIRRITRLGLITRR